VVAWWGTAVGRVAVAVGVVVGRKKKKNLEVGRWASRSA
jgi:hypothetical protein